jgi:hypothetical protein
LPMGGGAGGGFLLEDQEGAGGRGGVLYVILEDAAVLGVDGAAPECPDEIEPEDEVHTVLLGG